jgi:hypothetical protein
MFEHGLGDHTMERTVLEREIMGVAHEAHARTECDIGFHDVDPRGLKQGFGAFSQCGASDYQYPRVRTLFVEQGT